MEKQTYSPESNLEKQINNPRISIDKIKKHNGENFAFIKVDKIPFPIPLHMENPDDFSRRVVNLLSNIDYALSFPRETKNKTTITNALDRLSDKISGPFGISHSFKGGKAAVKYGNEGVIDGNTLLDIVANRNNEEIEKSIRELTGTTIQRGAFAGSPPKLSELLKDYLNERFKAED